MFKCQSCGLCCKGEANETFFGIRLFDFEAKRIKDKAKELAVKASIVPSLIIGDNNSKKELVALYKFNHKDCPFLANNKCLVYEIRPLMCRAFPIITSGRKDGYVVRSEMCPEVKRLKNEKAGSVKDVVKVFGDCYLSCFLLENLMQMKGLDVKDTIKEIDTLEKTKKLFKM